MTILDFAKVAGVLTGHGGMPRLAYSSTAINKIIQISFDKTGTHNLTYTSFELFKKEK